MLGIFRKGAEGGRIVPIDKGADREWLVAPGATHGAKDGELVEAEQAGPKGRLGLPQARVRGAAGRSVRAQGRVADRDPPARHPRRFPRRRHGRGRRDEARGPEGPRGPARPAARHHRPRPMRATTTTPSGPMPTTTRRTRAATSSGSPSPTSPITSGRAPRSIARRASGAIPPISPTGWCRCCPTGCRATSARCTRACRAPASRCGCRSTPAGDKIGHRFVRGLMRSAASLTYDEVQAAQDGAPNDRSGPLMEEVIAPLYAAYDALRAARARRQPLDLDLPERKIVLSRRARSRRSGSRDRLDAHRLIEEFMILANVAAAEDADRAAARRCSSASTRSPAREARSLRETAEAAGFTLAKGQVLQDRAPEPAAGRRPTGPTARADQPVDPALDDAGLLHAREFRPFRAGAAKLRAFHLAHPALCRPDRAPRADHRAWLGR